MSDQTIKYLLHLNWGYKLGLWTYKLKMTPDGLIVETSKKRLRNLMSILLGILWLLGHVAIILALLIYEWIRTTTNIPETALVIGGILLLMEVIVVIAFRLGNMDSMAMILQNTFRLREIYATNYNWNTMKKSGDEMYFVILFLVSLVVCSTILPAIVTLVTIFDFQPAVFYHNFFSQLLGKYYIYALTLVGLCAQLGTMTDMLYLFHLTPFLVLYSVIKSGMISSRETFESLDLFNAKRLEVLKHHRYSELFFHIFAIEFQPWVLIIFVVGSVSMIYQIFCTLFCPRQCGLFTTMIALVSLFVEFSIVKICSDMGSDFLESSASTTAAFKSQTLKPVELRIVKSMKIFALGVGSFTTIDRGTLPFIMSDVVVDNAISLLLSF